MAATDPGALPHEQHALPYQQKQHMDTLQSMLNLLFLHSGRFLKETQAGGGSGRMKLQLQRVVPHATERFHDALDELENEVRLAQSVLRRDMALLKQDRKKKEAAAKQHEVEKARLAAEARNPPPATDNAPVKQEKAAAPTPPASSAAQNASEPTTAMDATTDASTKGGATDGHANHDGKAPSPPQPSAETNTEAPKDPLFDATPPATNPNESDFDFDAMFGDAMDTSDQHNADHDMMDTSGDMDFNLDSGNDGSSLLRGLEDFAKNGGSDSANQTSNMDMDFTMPDLPGLDTNADSSATAAAKPAPESEPAPKADEPNTAPQQPPPPPPPPAAAAEEKKAEEDTTNNNINNNNDDMMGTMAADDLEDLFNMDEYANPEQSSFDDAFFNFE